MPQAVQEKMAVWQAGELVVKGQVLELLLQSLALGDVLGYAGHPNPLAVLIRKDLTSRLQYPYASVRAHQAVLEGERLSSLVGFLDRLLDEFPVLGMHITQERFVGVLELLRRPTEDAVKLVGPGNGVRWHIPLPASHVGYALRLGQLGLALLQRLLGLLALGDVPEVKNTAPTSTIDPPQGRAVALEGLAILEEDLIVALHVRVPEEVVNPFQEPVRIGQLLRYRPQGGLFRASGDDLFGDAPHLQETAVVGNNAPVGVAHHQDAEIGRAH